MNLLGMCLWAISIYLLVKISHETSTSSVAKSMSQSILDNSLLKEIKSAWLYNHISLLILVFNLSFIKISISVALWSDTSRSISTTEEMPNEHSLTKIGSSSDDRDGLMRVGSLIVLVKLYWLIISTSLCDVFVRRSTFISPTITMFGL